MFDRRNCLRLVAALSLVTLTADDLSARPGFPRPGGFRLPRVRRPRGRNTKPVDPLTVAVKDLQTAEKDAESNHKTAMQATQAAESIVHNQEQGIRQARQQALERGTVPKEVRDQMKARAEALAAILKDIRDAKKELAARKTAEAKTALASAITGLQALTGTGKKK